MFDKVQQKLAMSKKKMDTQVMLNMTETLHSALIKESETLGVTKSALIRTILETYLEEAYQRKLETPLHMRGKILGAPYQN